MWITNGEKINLHLDADGATLRNDDDLHVPLVKYKYLDNSLIFLVFPNEFDDIQINSAHSKTEFNGKLTKKISFILQTTMSQIFI
jgi:hypothetical protein